jgi:serine/threonine protein phosphatase PrpC
MEDAHCIVLDVNSLPGGEHKLPQAFFGVFDGGPLKLQMFDRFSGHGGHEASEFCAAAMIKNIIDNPNFRSDIKHGLIG